MRLSGFSLLFVLIFLNSYSQNLPENSVLFSVDTLKITSAEFNYALNKNNYSKEKISRKDIEDYLSLYINFKLKVRDAYSLGNDTLSSFLKEYNDYKRQLDDSYLQNDNWLDSLTRESYERMRFEIRASHILVNIKKQDDTVSSFVRINKIYDLLQTGTPFESVAKEYSDDPSVHYNGGDLGFFTSLQLVYPFEDMAYKTLPGNVSRPFRTKFGYHILKVTDKKPNPGTVSVAHIMLRYKQGMSKSDSVKVRESANDVFVKLAEGDWDKICAEYSEDNNTKNNHGLLPAFGVGRMIPSFAETAFALKNPGDISKPVETPYGWHIIRLIEKKPFQSYENIHSELREQVKQDDRYALVQEKYLDFLSRKNNYKVYDGILDKCISQADERLNDGKWKNNSDTVFLKSILFSIKSINYSAGDFFEYVTANEKPSKSHTPQQYMKILFSDFRQKSLLDFERNHLIENYPEYRWLVKEYKEGILMFNLMDSKVWKKATEDTTGTLKYFLDNRQKYTTGERANATIVMTNDTTVLNGIVNVFKNPFYPTRFPSYNYQGRIDAQHLNKLDSLYRLAVQNKELYISVSGNNHSIDTIKNSIIPVMKYDASKFNFDTRYISDSVSLTIVTTSKKKVSELYSGIQGLILQIDTGRYEKGSNDILKMIDWKEGSYYLSIEDKDYIVEIDRIFPSGLKNFE
jgi:peptidyl-prolyl cis-trans isomerase SurA